MAVDKGEEKIYSFSCCTLMFIMITSSFLGLTSFIMFQNIKQNAYISGIIGMILGLIFLFSFILLKKNMKGVDILDYNIYVFGKFFGNLINIFINISVFIIATIFLKNIVEFINSNYLIETSLIYIEILFLAPVAYAASKKISTISKLSQVIFIFDIIFFIVSLAGVFQEFDFKRLMPVLTCSTSDLIKSSLVFTICGLFSIFLLTTIPDSKVYEDKKHNKKMILMYFISCIHIIFIILFVTVTLGEELLPLYRFPEYLTLQEFSLFSILERVENTLSIQFILNVFLILTMMVYFIYNSIKKIIKKNFNKIGNFILQKNEYECLITIIICSLIMIFSNMFYNSLVLFDEFIEKNLMYIILIGFIFPMFLTLIGGIIKNTTGKGKLQKIKS